jgi:hypothetical protein
MVVFYKNPFLLLNAIFHGISLFQSKITMFLFFPEEARTKKPQELCYFFKNIYLFKKIYSLKVNHGEYPIRRKTFSFFYGNDRENLHGRANFQQNISKLSYNNFSW